MSCVKPDRFLDEPDAAALREQHERFCAELADGLHALAQPLTILRSALALLVMANEAGTDGAKYVALSARQIDRTCRLFSSVQSLLGSKTAPASEETIDFESLVLQTIEDRSAMLHARGVRLVTVACNSARLPVRGDRQRTALALAAALETAISVSSAGDIVNVDSSTADGFLEFAVHSSCKLDNELKSSDRLNLALAKANMLSQQGRFRFTLEPLRISLALPVQQPELEDSENFCCEECAQ